MTDSKLINLLRKLSPDEFKKLEKFTSSPFFVLGRNYLPLLDALKPFHPEFNGQNFTKKLLFKKLYPDEKYKPDIADNKLRILFSGMYKLCLEFLIQLGLADNEERRNQFLLSQLRLKNLDKEFAKTYAESIVEDDILKGSVSDLINKYLFLTEKKNYSIQNHDYEGIFESSLSIKENSVVAALINCFKFEPEKTVMARYNISIRNTLMNELIECLDIEKLLAKLKKNNDKFYFILLIYYTVYKMEKHKDDAGHFFKFRELMRKHHQMFGSMEKFALYVIMETYCASKEEQTGDSKFLKELLKVYKEMLDIGVYKVSRDEDFNLILFRNIVRTSSDLSEYEWLESFITDYSHELNRIHREDMKNFSYAIINFSKSKFEDSLENILKIKLELFFYKTDVRILLLKNYYELGYLEQAYSAADSTLHFINYTDEISDGIKDHVKNFIRNYRELLKLNSNGNHKSMNAGFLEKKISREKLLHSRDWLLKKASVFK